MDKKNVFQEKWHALKAKCRSVKNKWNAFKQKPGVRKTAAVFRVIGKVFYYIGLWIYRLRGLLLSIPVALAAVRLAIYNNTNLPELVGVNLQQSGEYAKMIARETAVAFPLVVTGICLVFVLFSRRVIYPWVISIFSLVLPILIYVTNVFPG
jgi:hypothetical protein